ncbi:MAG: hypothetical protein IK008_04155 [Bacteroidales bacterium]|nr:hypothetical protein [Bacteroidales bacterium]
MPRFPLIPFGVLLLALSCSSVAEERVFPLEEMREGDLVFRRGRSLSSHAVMIAEKDGRYSHIGMLVKDGGTWKVVHSVPDEEEFDGDFDRVKMDDLSVFFSADRASKGSFVHTALMDSARIADLCQTAIRMARDSVRFDHDYNTDDPSELYCTEFIWRLYAREGIDLSEGRRQTVHLPILGIDGDILLPEHLFAHAGNREYHSF